MFDFVPNNRYLREVLIFLLHSKKTEAEAYRALQKVYGAHNETTFKSFKKFTELLVRYKDDHFDADDRPRGRRPKYFEDDGGIAR